MKRLAWVDAKVVEAQELSLDAPYVMQRIHTYCGRVANVERHLALLRDASEELFGLASLCGAGDARRIISRLLEASRVTSNFSVPVAMRIDCRGVLSFEVENPTYGAGCYLRAKRPVGVTIRMTPPECVAQTSASVAIDALAESRVALRGGEKALWIDGDNMLISRPWMPLFAIFRDTVYTPSALQSVEYNMACRAIHAAGYHLVVRAIPEEVLQRMEELFVVDIMGVSAYGEVGEHKLLSAVAKRVAEKMRLFD
jgi:hypothetical protein